MATGRLGISSPAATTATQLFQVSSGKVATFNISVCNQNTSAVTIRIGLCGSTAAFSAGEYIEYDYTLNANESFERTGLVLDATKFVNVYASTTNVHFVAYGYEE